MESRSLDLQALRRLIKEAFPELLGYHVSLRGRVVKVHEQAGKMAEDRRLYSVDVQPIRADGSDDTRWPVIPDVEIPTWWAGPQRGIFMLPEVGSIVRIGFDYGDPSQPYISAILGMGYEVPAHPLGSLIIQHSRDLFVTITAGGDIVIQRDPDTAITIDRAQRITVKTPKTERHEVGGALSIICEQAVVECRKSAMVAAQQDVTVEAGQKAVVRAGELAEVQAPKVLLSGGGHPAARADLLVAQFNSHTHPTPVGPTGPPSPLVGVPSDPVEVA